MVNKASGLSTTPERHETDCKPLSKMFAQKIYVVHRIDKGTSGLVIFAKTREAHRALCLCFQNHLVEKTYIAVVHGAPSWRETEITLNLLPDGNKKGQTIVDRFRGKKSVTRFKMAARAGNYSAVYAHPLTGRTHQIRSTLAFLKHPVVCDSLYGSEKPVFLSQMKRGWRGDAFNERPIISRTALHAEKLVFLKNPFPDEDFPLAFEAPLPRDMKALLNQMKKINGFSSALELEPQSE